MAAHVEETLTYAEQIDGQIEPGQTYAVNVYSREIYGDGEPGYAWNVCFDDPHAGAMPSIEYARGILPVEMEDAYADEDDWIYESAARAFISALDALALANRKDA